MPQEHISRFERGNFMAINPERLIALAKVLQTSTDYLLLVTDKDAPSTA